MSSIGESQGGEYLAQTPAVGRGPRLSHAPRMSSSAREGLGCDAPARRPPPRRGPRRARRPGPTFAFACAQNGRRSAADGPGHGSRRPGPGQAGSELPRRGGAEQAVCRRLERRVRLLRGGGGGGGGGVKARRRCRPAGKPPRRPRARRARPRARAGALRRTDRRAARRLRAQRGCCARNKLVAIGTRWERVLPIACSLPALCALPLTRAPLLPQQPRSHLRSRGAAGLSRARSNRRSEREHEFWRARARPRARGMPRRVAPAGASAPGAPHRTAAARAAPRCSCLPGGRKKGNEKGTK